MEAASGGRLKLGVGMDAVVFLSPLRHPSSPARMASCTSRPAAAAASNPRLLKQRSIAVGSSNNSSSPSPPTRPTRSWSRPRRLSPSASSAAATAEPPRQKKKEKDLVFVAGATGRVGSRAVRELIKLGFRVRAAVRNAQRASSLVQSVEQLKLQDGATISPAEKLEIVECDLEKQTQDGLVAAIGDASLVVCSIGASEKEILDVTGPYRIDYMATKNLVQAAAAAKVEHFILVTSLGTNRIGFPAFLLNLFWGVLFWKRLAEEALIASGIPYTIIRPGGMERPTDAFKETHNLVVAAEDTYVGGLVSNLQLAELIGCMAKNRRAAYCKVVEAVAETTAPLLPMEQLLAAVPSKREPPSVGADDEEEEAAKAARPLSPFVSILHTQQQQQRRIRARQQEAPSRRQSVKILMVVRLSFASKLIKSSVVKSLCVYKCAICAACRYEDLKPPSSTIPCAPGT